MIIYFTQNLLESSKKLSLLRNFILLPISQSFNASFNICNYISPDNFHFLQICNFHVPKTENGFCTRSNPVISFQIEALESRMSQRSTLIEGEIHQLSNLNNTIRNLSILFDFEEAFNSVEYSCSDESMPISNTQSEKEFDEKYD